MFRTPCTIELSLLEAFRLGAIGFLLSFVSAGSVGGDEGQSLKIDLTGPTKGLWKDFNAARADQESGDMLQLVAIVRSGSRTVNWLPIRIPGMEPRASQPGRQDCETSMDLVVQRKPRAPPRKAMKKATGTLKSDLQEVDFEEAMVDLISHQTAYQAAMMATTATDQTRTDSVQRISDT